MLKIDVAFNQTKFAMKAYYLVLAALINIYGLGQVKNFRPEFKPVYLSVASLFDGLEYRSALLCSSLLLIGCCFWAALQVTSRWPRAFVFITLLLYSAVTISSGGITHLYQFWLWSSFMLACAPSLGADASLQKQNIYYLTWWGAQSVVLLMYGLSGLWKTIGFFVQIFRGAPGILSPDGLSYHYASEVIRAGADPLFGPWLLTHGNWQPPMAFAIITLQLTCFVGIFKSSLRPFLGGALILFHFSTYFFLAISYPTNFALIPILFLLMPNNK